VNIGNECGSPTTSGGRLDFPELARTSRIERAGYLRNMLEHVFMVELLQEAWFVREQTIEVLRAEVDAYGYDLVVRCNGVTRWVQLKTSDAGTSVKSQTVSRKLASLVGACVVYLRLRHCRIASRSATWFSAASQTNQCQTRAGHQAATRLRNASDLGPLSSSRGSS
jgi:hypothetical protein